MTTSLPPGLTVGYVYATAWTSRLIEYYEAGQGPSHATTLVEPGYVIDARLSGGVDRRPVSYLAGSRVEWYRLPAPEAAVRGTIKFLQAQKGQRYATMDILAFAIPPAFRKHVPAPHPWMCSWLQLAAEVAGGAMPKLPIQLRRATPPESLASITYPGATSVVAWDGPWPAS